MIGIYTISASLENADFTEKTLDFATKTAAIKLQPKKIVGTGNSNDDDVDVLSKLQQDNEMLKQENDQLKAEKDQLKVEKEALEKVVADFFKPSVP